MTLHQDNDIVQALRARANALHSGEQSPTAILCGAAADFIAHLRAELEAAQAAEARIREQVDTVSTAWSAAVAELEQVKRERGGAETSQNEIESVAQHGFDGGAKPSPEATPSPLPELREAAEEFVRRPSLTRAQVFLLDWLSKEDSSQLGECRGEDLTVLVAHSLAVLTELERGDYARVSLTPEGLAFRLSEKP